MSLEQVIRTHFIRRLVSTPAGRAHVLSMMIAAEEGDEAGVFDQLRSRCDDPELAKLVSRHQADELRHAGMYRACLERNGLDASPIPDELMIIRQVGREAGGAFREGIETGSSDGIATDLDVMNTYALLLVIEERGVQQFPLIGAEFRRIGDHVTADTFDRVTADEVWHTKYCQKIGRRFAPDDETWERAVDHYRGVEQRAFERVGIAGLAYAFERGLVFQGLAGRVVAKALGAAEHVKAALSRFGTSSRPVTSS
jgi:hypothetical protein